MSPATTKTDVKKTHCFLLLIQACAMAYLSEATCKNTGTSALWLISKRSLSVSNHSARFYPRVIFECKKQNSKLIANGEHLQVSRFIPPVVRPDTTSSRILLESRGSEGTRALINWREKRCSHYHAMLYNAFLHLFDHAFVFLHLFLRPKFCERCMLPPLSTAGSIVHLHLWHQLNLRESRTWHLWSKIFWFSQLIYSW